MFNSQVVKTVEHDAKELDHWSDSITALHRTQPPPNVHYMRFATKCHVSSHSRLVQI